MREYPKPGEIWEHYKGGRYEIIDLATVEADHQTVVIYRSLADGRIWTRPLDRFMGDVPTDYRTLEPRFVRVAGRKEVIDDAKALATYKKLVEMDLLLDIAGYHEMRADKERVGGALYRFHKAEELRLRKIAEDL